MAEGVVTVIEWVSPKQAIRIALGKLGYSDMMQTLEPDLIAWAVFGNDKISRKKTYKKVEQEFEVENNAIQIGGCFKLIDCVTRNGCPLTYDPNGSCGECVTEECCNVCRGSSQLFIVDDCYIHFSPAIADGITIKVKGYQRPIGPDGYPLVPDVCSEAIAEYVMWQLCFRERDNRTAACEKRWYELIRQARADLRTLTQQQLERIGYRWFR